MVRRLLTIVLVITVSAVAGAAADDPPPISPAPGVVTAPAAADPLRLGQLDWDRPPADSFARAVHLSLAEILNYPDDPWKQRRLSLWDAPLGRAEFQLYQLEHPAIGEPWREVLALNLVLPHGPLRFVDHGPLGDWYFNDPDPRTKSQLWTAFAIQEALPLLDSLFH